jgi:hypothetical protein
MTEILNPYYTGKLDGVEKDPKPGKAYNSIYWADLTPEYLIREAVNRGWDELPGRLRNLQKENDGSYTAEVNLNNPPYPPLWQEASLASID